jgi:hypothetical protein
MAESAEYGLMLWDCKSKGTVNNVVNLSRGDVPPAVEIQRRLRCYTCSISGSKTIL